MDMYPAGTFDAVNGPVSGSNDPNNSRQDHAFSGPGDIDRSADSESVMGVSTETTNERSRMWNAAAAEAARPTDFGRANPQPGSGGSVGDDGVINHRYGDS